jgi:hypothetical protein
VGVVSVAVEDLETEMAVFEVAAVEMEDFEVAAVDSVDADLSTIFEVAVAIEDEAVVLDAVASAATEIHLLTRSDILEVTARIMARMDLLKGVVKTAPSKIENLVAEGVDSVIVAASGVAEDSTILAVAGIEGVDVEAEEDKTLGVENASSIMKKTMTRVKTVMKTRRKAILKNRNHQLERSSRPMLAPRQSPRKWNSPKAHQMKMKRTKRRKVTMPRIRRFQRNRSIRTGQLVRQARNRRV